MEDPPVAPLTGNACVSLSKSSKINPRTCSQAEKKRRTCSRESTCWHTWVPYCFIQQCLRSFWRRRHGIESINDCGVPCDAKDPCFHFDNMMHTSYVSLREEALEGLQCWASRLLPLVDTAIELESSLYILMYITIWYPYTKLYLYSNSIMDTI